MISIRCLLLVLSPLLIFYPGPPVGLQPLALLLGEVRDEHGPVANATVRFKGQFPFVLTDADGRFALQRPISAANHIVASKTGYFIAGIESDAVPLVLTLHRLPANDCERYAWVDPAPDPSGKHNCANCHQAIYDEWQRSGHSRSVTNRRFLNLYDGSDWHGRPNVGWNFLAENADGAGVCTSCHGPTVPVGEDAYYDLRKANGVAARGVHCDYCHKISGQTDGTIGLTHGRFGLRLLRPEREQLFFGPLDDVDRGDDAFSPFYRDSRYCASCHEGVVFGVPVYTTYSEWLESPARQEGKQCQTCHMTPTGAMTNIAPGKGGIARNPKTLGNHRFFAGSQTDMLRRCLKVEVTLTRGTNDVRTAVAVRASGAGHRVPTGFIDRHLLLVVEGTTANAGDVVKAREGPVLPDVAGKRFAEKSGKVFAKQRRDLADPRPVPFWLPADRMTDTRLLPDQTDRSVYVFGPEVQRVRVRLIYRRFWAEVAASKSWPDDSVTVSDEMYPK
ncbi:MAG: hypothetical protein K2R98_21485 [Gemmataceae bacterium]|nr:hypothetical protein [Gemmataceae bacterium]